MTWHEKVLKEMRRFKENAEDIEIKSHFAVPGGSFTVWTKKRVYFPVPYYRGAREAIGSVSRSPDLKLPVFRRIC